MYLYGIQYMNLNLLKGYISAIHTSYLKNSEVDSVSLEILEHFAREKCLSAYQIHSKTKSTDLKMAYKNMNKRVNVLLSSDLIEETKIDDKDNKHNAKYYKLTEYGIYQLFLRKLESLLTNQSDIRVWKNITSNTLNFFRNYSDSMLFEIFLYPYFGKDILFAIGDYLLWNLYQYLSICCNGIEKYLKYSKHKDIPVVGTVFSWNKVPGVDDEKLLLHLKEIFNLESTDSYDIKKEYYDGYPTITVKTSSAPIIIKLDKNRKKAVMMSTADNHQYKELEYNVFQMGSEILVGNKMPYEESLKDIINESKKQLEQLIYGFVYDLASLAQDPKRRKEILYYTSILSNDNKFMNAVQEIYENRHKGFERGYKMLKK
jgi:hypothetical protein